MSLLEASEARKARLNVLKKRKAGESEEEYVNRNLEFRVLISTTVDRPTEGILKTRNFDPETRTLRKHAQEDEIMQDTVEKDVSGLAEQIIADDEQRREQELVGLLSQLCFQNV